MSLKNIPNNPFLVEDTTSAIAAVISSTGVQRLYPYVIRSTTEFIATVVATTFTSVSVANNGGLVQLTSAGVHGLTATAVGKNVYISWSAGNAPSGFATVASRDSTTAFTVNLPYKSSTVTMGTAGSTVTFGADNKIVGQATASPTYGAPMTVILTAHGLVPGNAMQFTAGTSFPSPITNSPTPTTYYVSRVIPHLTAGTASDRFTISTSPGGPEVYQTTASGSNGSGTFTMYPVSTSLTWSGHGRSVGDQIQFTTAGTLPASLALSTTYYIVKVVDANTVQISATAGGTPIVFTDAGSGAHTATLYYGTPTVTTTAGTLTLATIPVPGDVITRQGRMEVNVLYTMQSTANNKTLAATYGGQTFLSTGNVVSISSVQLNKIMIPNGAATLVTSAQAATGHGTSGTAFTTLSTAYTSAQNIVLTATVATADEWVGYEYYDINCE